MDDEILSFDAHRRHRDDDDLVRCVRCKKLILATETRCPECGVHFQGQAYEFEKPAERTKGRPFWIAIVAILALIVFVFSLIPR